MPHINLEVTRMRKVNAFQLLNAYDWYMINIGPISCILDVTKLFNVQHKPF